MSVFKNSLDFARSKDAEDELRHFRSLFHIPTITDKEVIYLTGNSLGLQPKSTQAYIDQELTDWANLGVEGHFHAKSPWYNYHQVLTLPLANIVGCLPEEVIAMNSLTVNLHLMLVSFYKPKGKRFKIIIEAGAFPSDQYALESQVRFHGYDPEIAIVEVKPRKGEDLIQTADIVEAIVQTGDELALVMMSGVNYYTGQVYDMPAITAAAHKVGAIAGFDLAHAVGNIKLKLHDWDIDFAVWCSYKYLNSGPGGIGGVFVHQKYAASPTWPRFAGWWGYNEETRFLMQKGFEPMYGAEGWQLSNAPILAMAVCRASLAIFEAAGIEKLLDKSVQLTAYMYFLLQGIDQVKIITPAEVAERGCQLSLRVQNGREIFRKLSAELIIADWREPDIIRVAPVPLYNTFEDVYRFCKVLKQTLNTE